MTSPDGIATDAPAPAAKRVARWEDFIDILYAPEAVLQRRQNQSPWPPILIVSIVVAVLLAATMDQMVPLIEGSIRRAMTARGDAPEGAAEAQAFAQNFGIMMVQGSMYLATPITILLGGIGVYLAGKIFGSTQTLNAAYVVTAYSFVPRALATVASAIQLLVRDASKMDSIYSLSLSPARFLDPATTSDGMMQLAARADVTLLWATVIIGVGYAVTGRLSTGKAVGAALVIWLAGSVPALVGFLAT
jgi:hypothetical protein